MLSGLLIALLEHIKTAEAQQKMTAALHPALIQAIEYLESRLDTPLHVPELTAQVHLSSSRLSDLFQQQFGCGPHQYHQRLRLERAAQLLDNPYLNIAEVGRACGYDDANYFSRQFRLYHGMSPLQFRRR